MRIRIRRYRRKERRLRGVPLSSKTITNIRRILFHLSSVGYVMNTDRVFVLLLVILLPLSGCFDGGSVGDADAADDGSEDNTIINNYYNNTTTVVQSPSLLVTSGTFGTCSTWTNTTTNGVTDSVCEQWERPADGTYEYISISENTTIRIHGLSTYSYNVGYFSITCDSGFTTGAQYFGSQFTMGVVGTDGSNCSLVNDEISILGSWSIVYEIVPVTVV